LGSAHIDTTGFTPERAEKSVAAGAGLLFFPEPGATPHQIQEKKYGRGSE
jgi:hypothetical protein